MQASVLIRQSGHTVHPDKVCLTVSACTHIRSSLPCEPADSGLQHVPAVYVTGGKAPAIAKSDKPKWDVKTEPCHTFKHRVMIWAESHCIEHHLTRPLAGDMSDFECQNVARRTILLALSATDTNYTADTTYQCEAWQLLLERHEPSRDIDVSDLYQKLSVATQRGRSTGVCAGGPPSLPLTNGYSTSYVPLTCTPYTEGLGRPKCEG